MAEAPRRTNCAFDASYARLHASYEREFNMQC